MALTSGNIPEIGKLVHKDSGATNTLNAGIEATRNAWSLLIVAEDGTVGVAAQGPIQSLEVILKILKMAGVSPKKADEIPQFGKVV